MKKFMTCTALIVCAAGIHLQAARVEKVRGSANYTNRTFDVPLEIKGSLTGDGLKAPKIDVYGPADLTNSQIGSAIIRGTLSAQGSTLKGETKVSGPAELVQSTMEEATIRGPLSAQGSTFTDPITVYGNVETSGFTEKDEGILTTKKVKRTIFKDELSVYGTNVKVELEDTSAKDITVDSEGTSTSSQKPGVFSRIFTWSSDEPQKVEVTEETDSEGPRVILKGNTVVTGTISFIGEAGTVEIEGKARHTGDVIGEKKKIPVKMYTDQDDRPTKRRRVA